jgi:hypothetical protein
MDGLDALQEDVPDVSQVELRDYPPRDSDIVPRPNSSRQHRRQHDSEA